MDDIDNYSLYQGKNNLSPYKKTMSKLTSMSISIDAGACKEGEILGLNLPDKIEMKVIKTEPAVKGNTTSSVMKDATLETGMEIKVPIFIDEGESIIVSTKDSSYVSRA